MIKVKAFALDPLYLFIAVMFLGISLVIVYQISNALDQYSTGMAGETYVKAYDAQLKDLDWVIPFFVGSACVAMLLYASLSGAVPISIVLFMIIAIIVDILIVYLNVFNTDFFDYANAMSAIDMPLTRFTLEWLPAILTVVMFLMGILMHSRTNY